MDSGIDRFINNKPVPIVSYDNNKCPVCGKGLLILQNNAYYTCNKCNFTCPIYHDNKDLQSSKPLYDHEIIDNFIKSFGTNNPE